MTLQSHGRARADSQAVILRLGTVKTITLTSQGNKAFQLLGPVYTAQVFPSNTSLFLQFGPVQPSFGLCGLGEQTAWEHSDVITHLTANCKELDD